MNGVPELLVLQLLSQKEMYGYQIVRAIADSTGNAVTAGEGCVYPILHAMEKKRWVATRRLKRDGRTRIYYRLTDSGRGKLQQASARWSQLARAIGTVLEGGKEGATHAHEPGL
jgi:PadR family transcriptional regulator PadR